MGLDNGIEIRNINENDIPNFVKYHKYEYNTEKLGHIISYEICYWRKCWALRNAIQAALHSCESEVSIDVEDIPAIIKNIKHFMSKEIWEYEGDSIWSFEEAFDNLVQSCINLMWLHEYWKNHPEITVIWYDSY